MKETSDWIAAAVGFRATKGFRAVRRAQRPVVGDRFVTVRDERMEARVTWIGPDGTVRFDRTYESGRVVECVAHDGMWPRCVLGALRKGAEFIPANDKIHP